MNKLVDISPYVLAVATIAIGIFDLAKDWSNDAQSWLKRCKAGALCIVGVLTLLSVHQDGKDKSDQKAASTKLIGQVEAANKAQTDNTALYLNTYMNLSNQVADLKTQVKTDALQKKLASVQMELENTEKALAPGPKSTLNFTFDPPTVAVDGKTTIAITSATLPVALDGALHINFDIMNPTDVDAVDGEFILALCDICKFAKEPEQSRKVSNEPDTQRDFPFERILARMKVGYSADIIAPLTGDISVGITFRCRTCIVPSGFSMATIHRRGIVDIP